jgi:hypothetical protein
VRLTELDDSLHERLERWRAVRLVTDVLKDAAYQVWSPGEGVSNDAYGLFVAHRIDSRHPQVSTGARDLRSNPLLTFRATKTAFGPGLLL